ncbi:UDP-N-acetylmuramate--L-alanine ligase [Clostridia bacterium]|nr:UDP-N-acetylmuramate--L-alanine ligase [Clostridia bacterium]
MDLLNSAERVHIVGVGGVSMSALADIFRSDGYAVSGSDMRESSATRSLADSGVKIYIGHRASNLDDNPDIVLRTAAAGDDNPEIVAARERGIPVMERAAACGWLMRKYKDVLCVAGTHGKTTTTGMCSQIALAANLNPTIMLGGTLPAIDAGHVLGGEELMVFEACEYKNSFLSFFPTVAVILNVELDHVDFFKSLDEFKASFTKFAALASRAVIVNADDPDAVSCVEGLDNVLTFGKNADVTLDGKTVLIHGKPYCELSLRVPGEHNVLNALAACAAAFVLGIDGRYAAEGLNNFTGTGRRFQRIGLYNGAEVVDDYAHHPTEVRATLQAAKSLGYKRVLVAFQPHTYTRTAALFGDFADALKAADRVYMAEIYAAREKPTGLSSAKLADALPNAEYYPTLTKIADALKQDARDGDIILTMGAGDITDVGHSILA